VNRAAAVAGQFYPASPEKLHHLVEALLEEAGEEAAPDRVVALVAPHAGYPYSGPAAAHAYARARGKRCGRVVLLGRSHHYGFPGAALECSGSWETPLGALAIDEDFARSLLPLGAKDLLAPHMPEHALEVHLPFLQVAMGDVPIVPVLFGSDADAWHEAFGRGLAALLEPDDLVVASTDLSHFLTEAQANVLDRHSLECILSKDYRNLAEEEERGECSMCGATAVFVAMICALACGADTWRLLDYRTSAAATGDFSRVVGYGAISMERAA
jgi:AmmeMemoRadiSam system protein B